MIREDVIRSVVESFQLEMFEKYSDRPDEYIGDDGIVCINCNTRQPPDQFCHMVSGEIKRKCRSCARNQSNLIKELKKQNPYPADGYVCPCCERNIEEIGQHGQTRLQNWVLDEFSGEPSLERFAEDKLKAIRARVEEPETLIIKKDKNISEDKNIREQKKN